MSPRQARAGHCAILPTLQCGFGSWAPAQVTAAQQTESPGGRGASNAGFVRPRRWLQPPHWTHWTAGCTRQFHPLGLRPDVAGSCTPTVHRRRLGAAPRREPLGPWRARVAPAPGEEVLHARVGMAVEVATHNVRRRPGAPCRAGRWRPRHACRCREVDGDGLEPVGRTGQQPRGAPRTAGPGAPGPTGRPRHSAAPSRWGASRARLASSAAMLLRGASTRLYANARMASPRANSWMTCPARSKESPAYLYTLRV